VRDRLWVGQFGESERLHPPCRDSETIRSDGVAVTVIDEHLKVRFLRGRVEKDGFVTEG
jgi:hypothetical protein